MSNFKSTLFQFCLALLMLVGCQVCVSSHAIAQTDSIKQELFERRRTDVMEFVHENHPKMEELLLALEENKPGKFWSAIKRIGRTLSKMNSIKDKHPERYAASVKLWKVKSEIEMVTARLANQDDPELRSQLDALVEAFVDNRRQMLELEKRQIAQRLERTNRLLETIKTDRDAFVKKNLRSVDRTIKQLNSGKPSKK